MIKKDQKGFVSIIVAATIMILLALITIGFTRYIQREQRQSLDRQLSRQALYAAESGINETFKVLIEDSSIAEEKTDCDPEALLGAGENVLDSSNGVEYTCILYDKDPTRLDYTVSSDDSKIIQLVTSSGNSFENIEVSWGNTDGTNNSVTSLPSCTNADVFPSARTNSIPVLKFDLTSIKTLSRADLLANTDYIYLSPCNGGSGGQTNYDFNDTDKGNVVKVSCNGSDTTPCTLTINNLFSKDSSQFLARFKPVYTSANVVIRGNERISSSPVTNDNVEFAGQFSIDVTAKARDIIRRLRAAIPLVSIDDKPEAVFQSFTDVCKLLEVNFANGNVVDTCP